MTDSANAVIRVAAAPHRRRDLGLGEALGVAHGDVLGAPVAVMDQVRRVCAAAVVDRLLERVQHEVGREGGRYPPVDDAPRKDIDDEGDVDEALR